MKTLEDFLVWRPQTERFSSITRSGKHFVQARGKSTSLVSVMLYSSPPCYVFDDEGRLVDWTSCSGDDEEFESKWYKSSKIQGITRADALHLVGLASGVRELSVVLQGPLEATEALRGILESDGLLTLPQSARTFRLRIVEPPPYPDPNVVYRVISVEPDPDQGYKIRVLTPWRKTDDAELGEELPEALTGLLRDR